MFNMLILSNSVIEVAPTVTINCHKENGGQAPQPHKSHVCHLCGQALATASTLKNHLALMHQTGFLYNCYVCQPNKPFRNKTQYSDHMDSHSGIKRQVCPIKV